MRTKLSPENPFGYQPKGFAWEVMKKHQRQGAQHLDYGAHDGTMLKVLRAHGFISKGVGLDLNREVIERNRKALPEGISLQVTEKNPKLDYPDEAFDSISIVGVLEHIYDQKYILGRFFRILKEDGILIVAVPGRHFFSFLDMGNFKFVFPRLHRWYYTARYSAKDYRERYVDCKNGMIGDIETEKRWHEHFSHARLRRLLEECGFEVTLEDGYGFFNRVLINLAYFLPGKSKRLLDKLIQADSKAFQAAEIFVVARKRREM